MCVSVCVCVCVCVCERVSVYEGECVCVGFCSISMYVSVFEWCVCECEAVPVCLCVWVWASMCIMNVCVKKCHNDNSTFNHHSTTMMTTTQPPVSGALWVSECVYVCVCLSECIVCECVCVSVSVSSVSEVVCVGLYQGGHSYYFLNRSTNKYIYKYIFKIAVCPKTKSQYIAVHPYHRNHCVVNETPPPTGSRCMEIVEINLKKALR